MRGCTRYNGKVYEGTYEVKRGISGQRVTRKGNLDNACRLQIYSVVVVVYVVGCYTLESSSGR